MSKARGIYPKGSVTSSKKWRTLSKEALYAPISTYLNPTDDPKTLFNRLKSKTYRESILIDFLTTVAKNKSHKDCDNHGAAPNRNLFESKLKNRSLVLIGGGISSTGEKKKRSLHQGDAYFGRVRGMPGDMSNKKRKKILNSGGSKFLWDIDEHLKTCDVSELIEHIQTLNKVWNVYSNHLLTSFGTTQISGANNSMMSISDAAEKMLENRNHWEIMGAHVKIKQCCSNSQYVDSSGTIVQETANTWRIVVVLPLCDTELPTRKKGIISNKYSSKKILETEIDGHGVGIKPTQTQGVALKGKDEEKNSTDTACRKKSMNACNSHHSKHKIHTNTEPQPLENQRKQKVKLLVVTKQGTILLLRINDAISVLVQEDGDNDRKGGRRRKRRRL